MLLDRLVAVRGEEGAVRRLIDPDQFLYRPGAARELGHCAVCPAIEVHEAVAIRTPQQAAVLQRPQIAGDVDPGFRGFGEQRLRRAARRIDREQVEPLLVAVQPLDIEGRSEEHTSELQSLMRISYAVFCLKKKK